MKNIFKNSYIYIYLRMTTFAFEKAMGHFFRFKKYSFYGTKCKSFEQYEAVIIRWYHTIEKGLSYQDYKPGFGKNNINSLLVSMENYIHDGYSEKEIFYQTAISVLNAYIIKNKEYGVVNNELENRIKLLPGESNSLGGAYIFDPGNEETVKNLGFSEFCKSRHSLRHFSNVPVDIEKIKDALEIAQFTPSACNRQGWRTIILSKKDFILNALNYQNGNEGFRDEIDKLLLIVADIATANLDRELFQMYIDGGMYAQNVLNSLHYEHLATIPLSASLTKIQEKEIRKIFQLSDSEVPILFVGVGNYPDVCQTTRSARHVHKISII